MGSESTATLNYQLTTYAKGHMNDLSETRALSERLAPSTPVPGSSGQYKQFNDKNSFMAEDTARGQGADPNIIGFDADDATYACGSHALEARVDKTELEAAGNNGGELAKQVTREGKIGALLNKAALSHTIQVIAAVLAGTTPVADRGNWSNPDIDPIDQLDEQLDALSLDCGSAGNIKLTIDVTAWRILRNHPKTKARCNGVQVGGITREQLAGILMFPVDVMIAAIVKDTTKRGVAAAKARAMASTVLLHYGQENPSLYDPSPFKTFTVGMGSPMSAVRSYTALNGLWEGHLIDWSRDIKQTSTLAMRRLAIA